MCCSAMFGIPLMSALLYAPIGAAAAKYLQQPQLYGVVAAVALVAVAKGKLIYGRSLYLLSGAALGYLYLQKSAGSQAMAIGLGAVLGYVVSMLMGSGGIQNASLSWLKETQSMNTKNYDPATAAAISKATGGGLLPF